MLQLVGPGHDRVGRGDRLDRYDAHPPATTVRLTRVLYGHQNGTAGSGDGRKQLPDGSDRIRSTAYRIRNQAARRVGRRLG